MGSNEIRRAKENLIDATLSFNGEVLDSIGFLEYPLDESEEPFNWDDCEGMEFI